MNRFQAEKFANMVSRLKEIEKSISNFDMDLPSPVYLEFKHNGKIVKVQNKLSNFAFIEWLKSEKKELMTNLKKMGFEE